MNKSFTLFVLGLGLTLVQMSFAGTMKRSKTDDGPIEISSKLDSFNESFNEEDSLPDEDIDTDVFATSERSHPKANLDGGIHDDEDTPTHDDGSRNEVNLEDEEDKVQMSFAGTMKRSKTDDGPIEISSKLDSFNEEDSLPDEDIDTDVFATSERSDPEANYDGEEKFDWDYDGEIYDDDDTPTHDDGSQHEVDLEDEEDKALLIEDNSDENENSQESFSESKKPGSAGGKNSEVRIVKVDEYPSMSCVLFGNRACNMSCDVVAEMISFTSNGVCDSDNICNCHIRKGSKTSEPPAIKFSIEGGYDKTDLKNYIIEKLHEEQKSTSDEPLLDAKYKEKFRKVLEDFKADEDVLHYFTFKVEDMKNEKLENILDEFFKEENIEKPKIEFPENRLEIVHTLVSNMVVNELINETDSASV